MVRSLPSRGRGLKYIEAYNVAHELLVAPFTGAWIEINSVRVDRCLPFTVAPFTGAWIEITTNKQNPTKKLSLPSRGRGLKFFNLHNNHSTMESLPSQSRGLKYPYNLGRWDIEKSLPSRGRGLKSVLVGHFYSRSSRSLHGGVD